MANKDIRIRTSLRSTPIPSCARAYVFYDVYNSQVKVVISDSLQRAFDYFNCFCQEQGIDKRGWRLQPFEDDFDVVLANDLLPLR